MKLKVIQVNIYKGKYLSPLVEFLKKEDPDFVLMQEVASGEMSFFEDKNVNVFDVLCEKLGMKGVFKNDALLASDPSSLHGNAVLSKYPIVKSDHVVLKEGAPISDEQFVDPAFFPDFPRGMVDASIDLNGRIIHVLSVHGAWTAPPTDTPETLRQARLISDHLKSLKEPFIMGGDLNTTPDKKVIKIISENAKNLMTDSAVKQTTHPAIHKIAPRGLLVDYIFVSGEFKKISVEVPEIIVSDHLPVVALIDLDL